MEKTFYSKPRVEILQVDSRLMADDFGIKASGYMDQGSEDSKGTRFTHYKEEKFYYSVWEED